MLNFIVINGKFEAFETREVVTGFLPRQIVLTGECKRGRARVLSGLSLGEIFGCETD